MANTYSVILAPVASAARGAEREREYIRVTIDAVNYSTAVALASSHAARQSKKHGREYGVLSVN